MTRVSRQRSVIGFAPLTSCARNRYVYASALGGKGGGSVGAGLLEVGPGEVVGGPEAVEGLVGGVAEAVAVAEVVQPAGLLHRNAEPFGPAAGISDPRRLLLE